MLHFNSPQFSAPTPNQKVNIRVQAGAERAQLVGASCARPFHRRQQRLPGGLAPGPRASGRQHRAVRHHLLAVRHVPGHLPDLQPGRAGLCAHAGHERQHRPVLQHGQLHTDAGEWECFPHRADIHGC